jgi:hypothetical protein
VKCLVTSKQADNIRGYAMLRLLSLSLSVVVLIALGCADSGPKRYRISGEVKVDGTPIPFGEVIFTPDAKQKNSGPQGKAPIKDGHFDTDSAGGFGIGGGPTIVRVNGMSGPGGKTLCEYETILDLPQQSSTKDIVVPGKDANNANPKGAGKPAAPEI